MHGVIMVTYWARRRGDGAADPKVAALRAAGALHPHPEAVYDDAFLRHPFFDPRDRVQVKYEMLRRHRVDGQPVTQVAASFSISRQAFYEALTAFTTMGLPGLLPKRPGPKRAHKCTDAILDFAERWQADEHERSAERIAAAVRQQFHVTIHPRSLQRALDRRKKKRRAPETSR
jgi:transposase